MWGEVRVRFGEDSDKEKLVAVDFARASINAPAAKFSKS